VAGSRQYKAAPHHWFINEENGNDKVLYLQTVGGPLLHESTTGVRHQGVIIGLPLIIPVQTAI